MAKGEVIITSNGLPTCLQYPEKDKPQQVALWGPHSYIAQEIQSTYTILRPHRSVS